MWTLGIVRRDRMIILPNQMLSAFDVSRGCAIHHAMLLCFKMLLSCGVSLPKNGFPTEKAARGEGLGLLPWSPGSPGETLSTRKACVV